MKKSWLGGLLTPVALLFWSHALVAQTLPSVRADVQQTILPVQARRDAPDLQCSQRAAPPRGKAPREMDPQEVPDEVDVQTQLKQFHDVLSNGPLAEGRAQKRPLWQAQSGQPLRVGIWGDSHLAAAFWSQEWARLSQLPPEAVSSRFLPASMNRPGVRLPLRKSCVGPGWQYEPAHAVPAGASEPGPGLVNLWTQGQDAWLSLDVRNLSAQADKSQLRLLYQQTRDPISLAIRIDGGEAQRVDLLGREGPAVLDFVGDDAMSTIELRVLEGPFRLNGLELPLPVETRLQLDVFGYPGATVAGWRQLQTTAMAPWWGASTYDVVVMAFGTNEGNVQPFDAAAYTQSLRSSVAAWRQLFPQAACLLVAPGDRGILVRRSQKNRSGAVQGTKPAPAKLPDLLKFTRVHAEIGRIQKQVAQAHGCYFWSMLSAMGGAGGSYRWAQQNPAWMAKDLIHFTVPGYQRLAQSMAQDLGWNASVFAPK